MSTNRNRIIINKLSKKRIYKRKNNIKKRSKSNKKMSISYKKRKLNGGGIIRQHYDTVNVKRARKLNRYASNLINAMNSKLDRLTRQKKNIN